MQLVIKNLIKDFEKKEKKGVESVAHISCVITLPKFMSHEYSCSINVLVEYQWLQSDIMEEEVIRKRPLGPQLHTARRPQEDNPC